jgi:hypothetical protein
MPAICLCCAELLFTVTALPCRRLLVPGQALLLLLGPAATTKTPAAGSCCTLLNDTGLEAVNLDKLLLDQLLLCQELQDVLALIALQLNDLA